MSATYAYDEQSSGGHPLRPGASPRAIRAALLSADRTRFDLAYEAALAESRESLDLAGLFIKMLEHWRRVAVLQSDPEGYRRVVRHAAEALTGVKIPADEPLEITRAKAGMQVYRVTTDEQVQQQVQQQIDALPADALPSFAELKTLLEVNPWVGDPVNDQNPDGPVRTMTFGRGHEGLTAYLILDDMRRVDLLQVTWVG